MAWTHLTLNENSTPKVQHRMKQTERNMQNMAQSVMMSVLVLNRRMEELATAVWPCAIWGTPAWQAPNTNMARAIDMMGSENRSRHGKTEDCRNDMPSGMVVRNTQKRTCHDEQIRDGPRQRESTTTAQMGRPHVKGAHRHGVLGSLENKRLAMGTSRKILTVEVRSSNLKDNTNVQEFAKAAIAADKERNQSSSKLTKPQSTFFDPRLRQWPLAVSAT